LTFSWADLAGIAAIVIAACAGSFLLVVRNLRRKMAENHREMERRLQALTEALSAREHGETEGVSPTDARDGKEIEPELRPLVQGRPLPRLEIEGQPAARQNDEIAPQIQAAIAAAAIALLGNHARVRAARRVPSQDVVSPWTQQGRVIVQSSHNLRVRGR